MEYEAYASISKEGEKVTIAEIIQADKKCYSREGNEIPTRIEFWDDGRTYVIQSHTCSFQYMMFYDKRKYFERDK